MTNDQILVLLVVLVALYFYWKSQPKPVLKFKSEPEVFWDAQDLELDFASEIPVAQKGWFSKKRWLSDREIDWALEKVLAELPREQVTKYKVLESTQFMFTKESLETKDADARFSFPVLLSELTGFKGDLVFIPVNNPDFHWSLLVYEVKEKKFYHYDTLQGANDSYVKPLVEELLKFLLESWQDSQYHWVTEYTIKQGNTWDCGVAVIEIVRRIIEKQFLTDLGSFDFPAARKAWRNKLTSYYD